MVTARGRACDGNHGTHARIGEALDERSGSDHAGGPKEDDVHRRAATQQTVQVFDVELFSSGPDRIGRVISVGPAERRDRQGRAVEQPGSFDARAVS
jgi:hypothetical protein